MSISFSSTSSPLTYKCTKRYHHWPHICSAVILTDSSMQLSDDDFKVYIFLTGSIFFALFSYLLPNGADYLSLRLIIHLSVYATPEVSYLYRTGSRAPSCYLALHTTNVLLLPLLPWQVPLPQTSELCSYLPLLSGSITKTHHQINTIFFRLLSWFCRKNSLTAVQQL